MTLQDTFESEATGNESRSAQQVTKMPPAAVATSAGVDDNAAEDEVVPGTLISRPCHALEALFVDFNIRFAVGMLFAAPSVVSVKAAREALKAGLKASGLDRLRVDNDATSQDGTKSIVLSRESSINLETVPVTDESLSRAIEALVARNDVPSTGTVRCYVLLDDNNRNPTAKINAITSNESDAALGIVINANHALCDGRLLRECMSVIVDAIGGSRSACPASSSRGPTVLRNLTDELTTWSHQNPPPVPKYLPPSHESVNVVRLSEIPYFVDATIGDETKGGCTLRRHIPGSVALACIQQLRSKQASVTGFMAACWIQAIDEAIMKSKARRDDRKSIVTISCLVALHDQLPEGLYTNAFGTVTLAGESVRSEATDGYASPRHDELANRMLDLAANCTTDLRQRIHRGEAASQGLALCRGEFESSVATPGTIELSNHGVYRTSDTIQEVAMQQRFDGYDGVSVLMATESHTNIMRLVANVGPVYSRPAIEGLMDRVVELWSLLASR